MIYLDNVPLRVTMFPDRTSQVWQIPNLDKIDARYPVAVHWAFENEGEFMHLAQLSSLLRSLGLKFYLVLKYLPYGRQDKEVSNNATFALRTFAHMLNQLNFETVHCIDPHSSVAKDFILNFKEIYPMKQLLTSILETDSELLCYPDSGAKTKYLKIQEVPFVNFPYIYGEKVRDQSTGRILSYSVSAPAKDQKVMIMDDICDGGATFVILAKELLKGGAKEVNLFVTHGIFSKGLKPLFEAGIKRIFTQDGEASEDQNKIAYRRL